MNLVANSLIWLPSVSDTESLGEAIGAIAVAGDLIVLDGPLGAGKTALTRGIGRGLGVGGVTSPTFVMARVHRGGRVPLVHVDAYRLGGIGDLDALDLDATVDESVTVVEWGAGVVEVLTADHLLIQLARDADGETRRATLLPFGPSWGARLGSD